LGLTAFRPRNADLKEGTLSVNGNAPVQRVEVTGNGAGVTNQSGTHLLGEIAQRLGVAAGLSQAMAGAGSRTSGHDRGRVLTQVAMMLAGGGRCLADLKTLRHQPGVFGTVASDPTAWRAMQQVDDDVLAAMVAVRQAAIRRLLAYARIDEVVLDVDATLVDVDSDDKEHARATFKGGFGFAPMLCVIEPLGLPAGVLRPGNATANNAGDQLAVVDEAIGALPEVWRAGHGPGDDASLVRRRLLVRADTAGGTRKMLAGLAARNVVFSVGMRTSDVAVVGIRDIDETSWRDAVDDDGKPRDGAQVTEAPALVPAWAPEGTRAIVRRERPHPGASLRLWDYNGWRHQVVLTNDDSADIAAVEATHRGHAQVENRIKNLKDTGLSRLPFGAYDANRAWVQLVLLAAVLLAALQQLIDDDELRVAEPRRIRYALLHVAAKIAVHARRTWLHLDAAWPWTPQLLIAHRQLPRLAATLA
jgi:hypothetical protein